LIGRFHHSALPLGRLLERKHEAVTVVLPAREVADTIGPIVERLLGLRGLVDQVLVVDAASVDGTAELAQSAGAEVRQEAELMPELGPPLGKGDAMWRALSAARGELIAYLDSDTRRFSAHFATGMLGPLLLDPAARFVKGAFRRPFATPGGQELPADGGRVTELMARPLLSAFYPELAGFAQPLAGEVAARRELFHRLPFATGYAVETAMLLDAHGLLGGTDGMVEVDLDVRRNRHKPLAELGPMADEVLQVIADRLRRDGRLLDADRPLVERPPFASLPIAA
jgi:glucosyl-3-phosphoglycerate synthase